MASLKLVRSPISRVLFDSWFQAIAPRQENERLRKFVLGSGRWRSYIVRTPHYSHEFQRFYETTPDGTLDNYY